MARGSFGAVRLAAARPFEFVPDNFRWILGVWFFAVESFVCISISLICISVYISWCMHVNIYYIWVHKYIYMHTCTCIYKCIHVMNMFIDYGGGSLCTSRARPLVRRFPFWIYVCVYMYPNICMQILDTYPFIYIYVYIYTCFYEYLGDHGREAVCTPRARNRTRRFSIWICGCMYMYPDIYVHILDIYLYIFMYTFMNS